MKHRLARNFLLLCLYALPTLAFSQVKPNVLLIVADDLGLQLSCYGDPHIQTPHIDALAAAGTRFKTAYITQSSCSPSRVSIFTGLFPHTHGHIGLAKKDNPPLKKEFHRYTLPALMKAAGYRTGIIGKLHVNPAAAFPFELNLNDKIGPQGAREVRLMADAAGKFVSADSAKPFFLVMSYVDPHAPYPPQVDGLPEKPTLPSEIPPWPFQQVADDTTRKNAANYYNAVRRLDAGIGLLMETLKAAGRYDNTLVIFLSDNGPPFARGKTTCYEAGLRTPFLLRWPGITKPGSVSDAFVSSVDILPTILDAAGIGIPAHVQGRSLRKVAAGDNDGWRATLAGEFHQHGERPFFPRRALRDARYQIIHNLLAGKATTYQSVDGDPAPAVARLPAYDGTPAQKAMAMLPNPPEWELYDLDADPWQFHNLAADPARAATLQRMQGLLLEWRQETRDPFLDPTVLAAKHAAMKKLPKDAAADIESPVRKP
jgi:N-sulfoglucosamine sulfohydrolase